MQEKRSHKINEKLLEQVISVAYGDGRWLEKFSVFRKTKKNPAVKALLDEYTLTARSIHKLREEDLPDSVVNLVLTKTNKSANKDFFGSIIYSGFFSKPVLSAGTAGIILLIVSVLVFFQPKEEILYSKSEIELAQKQLQESIAIVNKVFSKAEHQLDSNVLPNHVDKHLNKGFYLINDILIGG
jgi:hypothetical protein